MIVESKFSRRVGKKPMLIAALMALAILISFGRSQSPVLLAAQNDKPATGAAPCDTSFLAKRFKYRVKFKIGKSDVRKGGRIEIKEVWGTRPEIEVGGQYLVSGKYVLPKGEHAGHIYFYASAGSPWGETASLDLQDTEVDKPEGEFALVHGMAGVGYFHVIFTEENQYSNWFADVYFGTGDNVYGTDRKVSTSRDTKSDNATALPSYFNQQLGITGVDSQRDACTLRDAGAAQTMLGLLLADKNLKLPHAVRFELGKTEFQHGDTITINEIRGTSETFSPGNVYVIKGTYTLKSHASGMLAAYTTAKDAAHALGYPLGVQSTNIARGSGSFQLVLPMWCEGWPHLCLYCSGGEASDDIYFGTGKTVLKHW